MRSLANSFDWIVKNKLLILFCSAPFFLFGVNKNLLQSLQQIRNLIPERYVEEEFEIFVDQKGLEKPLKELCSHHQREMNIPSTCSLGDSKGYFLRWTFSGESVRILDSYLQFEYGPYWKYPTAMMHLDEMESATYGVDQ